MSVSMVDSATLLLPAQASTGNQTGVPLKLHPRFLATSGWIISVTVAPSASCVFSLAVASLEAGPYISIATFTWPVGEIGQKQVSLGVQGNMAQLVNNQAVWMRASIATSGTVTCSSWLGKPGGSPGLASRSYSLDGVNPF
jgi:hypothetical protein